MRLNHRINLMLLAGAILVAAGTGDIRAADLCTGAVDPYNIVAEKGRFYASAGKDSELSASEFNAAITEKSFRRKFDKWPEMLKFDRDGNSSIDWLEAGAYRYALRRKVLTAHDANRDGKLAGGERESACKALAAGKLRFAEKKKSSEPDPRLVEYERRKEAAKKSEHKTSHSSHRRSSHRPAQESHARKPEQKTRTQRREHDAEAQKRKDIVMMKYGYWIEKHDEDGDGKLNAREEAAAKAAYHRNFTKASPEVRAASQAKLDQWRKRYAAKIAARKSGQKQKHAKAQQQPRSEEEQKRLDEKAKRKAEFLEKYDSDGDGKINSEEKKAYVQELKKQKAKRDKEKTERQKEASKRKTYKSRKSKPRKKH